MNDDISDNGRNLVKMLHIKRLNQFDKNPLQVFNSKIRSNSFDVGQHALLENLSDDEGIPDANNNKSKTSLNSMLPKFILKKLKSSSINSSNSDVGSNSNLSNSPPEIKIEQIDLGSGLDLTQEDDVDQRSRANRRCQSVDFGRILASDNASIKAIMSLMAYDGMIPEVPQMQQSRRPSTLIQPPQCCVLYQVSNNDTLASVAAKHKSTVTEIKKINQMMSEWVFPGQMLYVPGEGYKETTQQCSPVKQLTVVQNEQVKARRFSAAESIKPLNKLKKIAVFSAEVKYLTDHGTNVSGMLTINSNEVLFEALKTEDEWDLDQDLIKYRMSLGHNMVAAWLTDQLDTCRSKTEYGKMDENQDSSEIKNVKYLRVKLGIPEQAMKELPTISKLLRESIPLRFMVEHYFLIPDDVVPSLDKFMKKNYSSIYNKEVANSKKLTKLEPKLKNLSSVDLGTLPLPPRSSPSAILLDSHFRSLVEHLPPKADGRPWFLTYGSHVHGSSLQTLYRRSSKIKDSPATLVVIKDKQEQIFGALLASSLVKSDGIIGTGESFLFTFYPVFKAYNWTGKNSLFAKTDSTYLSFGASGGQFGLYIDEGLYKGTTNKCETFDNEPLTNATDFSIYCIEVWSFPFSVNNEI